MKTPKRHVKRHEELDHLLLGITLQLRGAIIGHYFNIVEHIGGNKLLFDRFHKELLTQYTYPIHLDCTDITIKGLHVNENQKLVCITETNIGLELKRIGVHDLLELAKVMEYIEGWVFNL